MKIYEPNADGDQIQSFVLNILDGKKKWNICRNWCISL